MCVSKHVCVILVSAGGAFQVHVCACVCVCECVCALTNGRPREKPTLPISLSSPPNSKPPIPFLDARYLMLYPSHSLEIWHSGGFCGGPLRILHPLWQEKGAILRLPRSTCASGYKHHDCYVTMLQCQIRGRGTGKAGERKAPTQGTQGKKTEKSVAVIFSPVFPLSVAGNLYASN